MNTTCTPRGFVESHLAPVMPVFGPPEDFASQLLGRNAWTYDGHVSAYIRLVERLVYNPDSQNRLDKQVSTLRIRCLDIANVSVLPKFQGQGHFRRWYKEVEELAQEFHLCIYVESILSPIILSHCVKQGFTQAPSFGEDGPPCYYKQF